MALKLKWQGCADAGLCYPPSVWDASVKVAAPLTRRRPTRFSIAPSRAVDGEEEFLDPDQAFALTAEALSVNNLQLNWRIADGYYLYKERISVEPADAAQPIGAHRAAEGRSAQRRIFRRAGGLSPEPRRDVLGAARREDAST